MSYKLLNNIDFYDATETDEKLKALECHVEEDLATEVARAKAVEEHLANDVTAEKDRAEAVENLLRDKIETEVERASGVEIDLETRLNNLDIPEYEEVAENPINLNVNKPLYWVGSDTKLQVKLQSEEMEVGRTYKLMLKTPIDFEGVSFELPEGYRCAELPILEASKVYHMYFCIALDNIIICHTDIVDLKDGTLTTALLEPIWAKIREIEAMLSVDTGTYAYLSKQKDGSLYTFVSANGLDWSNKKICDNVKDACFLNDGNKYIAFVSSVSGSDYKITSYLSTDGVSWAESSIGSGTFTAGNFSVKGCYNKNSGFFAFVEHSSSVSIYHSTDGIKWTGSADAVISDNDTLVKAYPYGAGCVVFSSNKTNDQMCVYLYDGANFNKLADLDSADCVDIRESNGKYLVVVGGTDITDGTKLLVTSDFATYKASTVTYRNTYGVGVTYNDTDGYVVVSATREGAFCYKNKDLSANLWAETPIDKTAKCNAICLMDNGATPNYHVLMSSDNGVKQAQNYDDTWNIVTLADGSFISGSGSSSLKHITIMELVEQVAKNTASISLMPALSEQVNKVTSKIEEETARAKQVEEGLAAVILAETKRATAAEEELRDRHGDWYVDITNVTEWTIELPMHKDGCAYVPTVTVKDTEDNTVIPDTRVYYENGLGYLTVNFNGIATSGRIYLS